jgi:Predicted membrane protein
MLGLFGPSPAERLVAFLIDWLILALAVWVAAQLVPGIHLEGLKSTLLVAGILGLLNALIKPTLKVLTIPLTFLTLGLFAVLLNAVLLALTDWIAGGIGGINFKIDGFFAALLGAVAISLVTFIVGRFVDSRRIARGLASRRLGL